MRAVWIDEGADPDYPKLRAHGVTRISRSARDPSTTPETLDADRRAGFYAAVHRVAEWDAGLEPGEWAELLSGDVSRLGGDGRQLAVQANAETHSEGWLVAFWTRWRQLRPTRATSWALEGGQGGRLGVAPGTFRAQILSWRVRLVPEAYQGDMAPLDPAAVKANLVDWGFPASLVSPFYDAAALPPDWNGYAFEQGRLP